MTSTPHPCYLRGMLSQEYTLQIGEDRIPLVLRPHRCARRMTLRYHAPTRQATLTLPRRTSVAAALRFAEKHKDWLHRQMLETSQTIPFAPGANIPLRGALYRIVHTPGQREVVRIDAGTLHVSGATEHLARRLRDWLKKEARRTLLEAAHAKAAQLGVKVVRVTVRDTRSRWGSCNSQGHLSFSWRILFAPPEVLDYLVAHEVAHLKEMNHSLRFWRIVESLCPGWEAARGWLRKHGQQLHRYG